MKLIYSAILALMIMAGVAAAGVVAGPQVDKICPMGQATDDTVYQVWEVTITTDEGGNASDDWNFLFGRLYSVDVVNESLEKSTPVVISRTLPYEEEIVTIDPFSGNNTTYVRDGSEMFAMMGDINIAITNGDENATVPVYFTLVK